MSDYVGHITIDLTRTPETRWEFTKAQIENAVNLAEFYYRDLASATEMLGQIEMLAEQIIPPDYLSEMRALAEMANIPLGKVVLCNGYYDLIKPLIGCTGFAYNGPDGPVHTRNLDWWTENSLLSDCSELFYFTGAPAGDFYAISWPGYVGVLSGMAHGRFAVTLNAVLSDDPFEMATPVSLRLREALESCQTYDEAVSFLQKVTLPSDCLLLVSGPKTGQYCVIERTPKRQATRKAENGLVAVTNDYKSLNLKGGELEGDLQQTSDGRYKRICQLAALRPASVNECLDYLSDKDVFMHGMTVQQMAFCVATGEIAWRRS